MDRQWWVEQEDAYILSEMTNVSVGGRPLSALGEYWDYLGTVALACTGVSSPISAYRWCESAGGMRATLETIAKRLAEMVPVIADEAAIPYIGSAVGSIMAAISFMSRAPSACLWTDDNRRYVQGERAKQDAEGAAWSLAHAMKALSDAAQWGG